MSIIPSDAPVLLPISIFCFRLREYGFGNRITHGAGVMDWIAVYITSLSLKIWFSQISELDSPRGIYRMS